MSIISFNDIRYNRDILFYNRLKPVFDSLLLSSNAINTKVQELEEHFYFQLSNSIKVDGLDHVKSLLKTVSSRLQIDLKADIFIFQSAMPNAFCVPRYKINSADKSKNLMVLVSQHFFNDLNTDEQTAILGHEIGHFLFGHIDIPKDVILKNPIQLPESIQLKSDVLMWSICSEISSDIVGLVANGVNKDAFISAMLKFATGLNSEAYKTLGENSLKNIALSQFKEITYSVHEEVLNTHPITPLRLKLAEKLAEKDILKNYGKECNPAELEQFKYALNSHIDHYISRVYSDILQEVNPKHKQLLLKLAIAVAISDQMLDRKEFELIRSFIGASETEGMNMFAACEQNLNKLGRDNFLLAVIGESVTAGRNLNIKKPDVIQLVRNLLFVAVSDGPLNNNELMIIVSFCQNFGITREEVLFLKNQMHL